MYDAGKVVDDVVEVRFDRELPGKEEFAKKKVLLLSRDAGLVESLEVPLELEGYELILACSEHGARQRIRLDEPDALLLDLGAMQRDLTLLKDLQVPRGRPPVPVILLAREREAELLSRGFMLGASACVTGRLDPREIVRKVKRCRLLADLASRPLQRAAA